MVTDKKKDNCKKPEKQGSEDSASEPNKINASTPYDFNGKNLTPYGGLLPVITMLEKLGFQFERMIEPPQEHTALKLFGWSSPTHVQPPAT